MTSALTSLVWFAVIVALIPLALWLLKRSPLGAMASAGPMRTVAALPLSPGQRLVTVEVGAGDEQRWLVLGVTAQSITVLHTMAPQAELPAAPPPAPFSQLMTQLLNRRHAPPSPDAH